MKTTTTILLGMLALVAAALLSFMGIQYHDGRCGAQMWETAIGIVIDADYDEFGIEERWLAAHSGPCRHIWMLGALESDDGEFWPPLHFKVARGADVKGLLADISKASPQDLHRVDKLGRTLIHWAVLWPYSDERMELVETLLARGLSLDVPDADGLTAREWQQRFEASPQAQTPLM